MERGFGVLFVVTGLGLVVDGLSRERASSATGFGVLLILAGTGLVVEESRQESSS